MFPFVLAVCIFLAVAFLISAVFIFRHFMKYGYLVPRFKIVMIVFALIAAGILSVSFYFLMRLHAVQGESGGYERPSPSSGVTF